MIYTQHRNTVKWIEMLASILLIGILDYMFSLSVSNWAIDPLIFYILLFALRYGLLGAFVSFTMTMLYHLFFLSVEGSDILLFLYDRTELSWIIFHFLVAMVCGIFSTSFQERYLSLRLRHEEVVEENNHLLETVEKLRLSQSTMQKKVLDSDHTLTKIYQVGLELDQTAADIVRDRLVDVLKRSFKAENLAIYHVDASKRTLRLHVRFGEKEVLPQTLFIDPSTGIYQRMFKTNAISIRTMDETDVPLLIAPIRYDGKIQEVVVIQAIDFNRLTSYEMNIMQLILDWTGTRIEKALTMEWNASRGDLIEGTRIHQIEPFNKKVALQQHRAEQYDQPYSTVVLPVEQVRLSLIEMELILRQSMREIDIIGYDETNQMLHFLLPGTPQENAEGFKQRIKELFARKGGDLG